MLRGLYFHCIKRNITLGRYLDTDRNIKNIYGMMYDPKYIYICSEIRAVEQTRGQFCS